MFTCNCTWQMLCVHALLCVILFSVVCLFSMHTFDHFNQIVFSAIKCQLFCCDVSCSLNNHVIISEGVVPNHDHLDLCLQLSIVMQQNEWRVKSCCNINVM